MIRFALVILALSLLWPSPPVTGPVMRTSGTLTTEYDESDGGIRLTGGFELTRLPAAAGLERSGPIGKPLRRAGLPAVAPLVRRTPGYRAGASQSTLRGAHPFFDSTAPPLA
jgi:hypothetical protein